MSTVVMQISEAVMRFNEDIKGNPRKKAIVIIELSKELME